MTVPVFARTGEPTWARDSKCGGNVFKASTLEAPQNLSRERSVWSLILYHTPHRRRERRDLGPGSVEVIVFLSLKTQLASEPYSGLPYPCRRHGS